ncbi:MAG: gamma-glutamyltransferase [Candidatus Thorarchaeota archaeon]
MFWRRTTGRSDIIAKRGVVASSQPLATQAGLEILRKGGNAVDAAVATAAVLDVVEPYSTGCGGDAFALIHLPGDRAPRSFNGSGRAGSLATLDDLLEKGWAKMPVRGGAPVTVPGAMHLWGFLVEEYGRFEMKQVLEPAIHYARNGFPVSPVIADIWPLVLGVLRNKDAKRIFTHQGQAPIAGDIMKNEDLARVFELVASEGVVEFYSGATGQAIVETVRENGGFLTIEDMAKHRTNETDSISTDYRGISVFEHPPNGQGFAALEMLNIMEQFDFSSFGPLEANRYHTMIEAKKMAYADLYRHNADPEFYEVPLKDLLDKNYAQRQSLNIANDQVMDVPDPEGTLGTDTVYLATADEDGMAVSFINSLYMGFGSGLVASGAGIKLQNRGSLFSLDPQHPNCYAPGKLPFHTIIPGALYDDNGLYGVFGIMGGAHQAQAHAQFVSNIVDHGMRPQEALDHPRFHHDQFSNTLALENGIPIKVQGELRRRGHNLRSETMSGFGGGQAILKMKSAWIAGSDYRKDGQAAGF